MGYLAEEALEEGPREDVPSNGVRDRGEHPVELPQRRLSVRLLPRDALNQVLIDALNPQMGLLRNVPHQCRLRQAKAPLDSPKKSSFLDP